MKNNVVFLAWKLFSSDNFFIVSEARNKQVTFAEKQKIKINSLKNKTIDI